MISLRPYQHRAVEEVLAHFARGTRRVLLVLPTGGGKTVIFSEIVRRCLELYGPAVVLAHRRELIKQTFAKLCRNGLSPADVGIIIAGVSYRSDSFLAPTLAECTDDGLWQHYARRRPRARTQVGSIDTFRNVSKPHARLIVVDEAHRALAASYRSTQADYPEAFHLGVTATPFRADGKGLIESYDVIVVAATYQELADDGYLVIPRAFGPRQKADLGGVRRTAGEYNAQDLAKAVDRGELVGDIVKHWLTHGNDLPTFAFAVNVEHSKHLAARFVEAGVPALHVDGSTETSERDDAIAALREGRVKVLTNCDVFTEGTDVPAVKTIVLARPTLSPRVFMQQAGRGARPYQGQPFTLLDHARCCETHGMPHWPVEYTLEGRKPREKKTISVPPTKDCPECYAIAPIALRVCECGYEWPAAEAAKELPTETAEQLVELNPSQKARLRGWDALVAEWERTNEERAARGETRVVGTWCSGEWKRRSGNWPPKGAKVPRLTFEQEQENERILERKKAEIHAARAERAAARTRRPEVTPRPQRFEPSRGTPLEEWAV